MKDAIHIFRNAIPSHTQPLATQDGGLTMEPKKWGSQHPSAPRKVGSSLWARVPSHPGGWI